MIGSKCHFVEQKIFTSIKGKREEIKRRTCIFFFLYISTKTDVYTFKSNFPPYFDSRRR